MNIKRVACFALGASVFAASCTKEAAEPGVYDWVDGEIYFRTSLAAVASSRGQDMTLDALESFQVSCFNTPSILAGINTPYFQDITFSRKAGSKLPTYETAPGEETYDWPSGNGIVRFFAFSPSIDVMKKGNAALDRLEDEERESYFKLKNSTETVNQDEEDGTGASSPTASIGYRLGPVRINPDISGQFDFIIAEAAGTRWKDFAGGVDLAFRHQLCQVEIMAWGKNQDGYDFDIAGVRIGNPVAEATFVFADDSSPEIAGTWEIPEEPVTEKVEYLYGSAVGSETGDIPLSGDTVYRINSGEHATQGSAASIMGRGGCAMVIPTLNAKWEGLGDPNTATLPYTTDRMYFSILMRVTDSKSGKTVYPYPNDKKGMTVISYAVDESGNIIRRLYRGSTGGEYFTDIEHLNPYEAKEGEAAMDFGWAAVPVDADWKAGKKYIYTLNYSEGIGLHDPADPEPGKPIVISRSPVLVDINVTDWGEGTQTDVTVPRK